MPQKSPARKSCKKDFRKLVLSLENRILTGGFRPREHLVEATLAEMFQVSRYWIRDALKILETKGVVTVTPYKGAMVAELNEDELEEIFVIRVALEQLAMRLAMQRVGPVDAENLKALCVAFDDAIATGDLEEMIEADTNFHNYLFQLADNQTLRRMITELRNRCHIIRYSAWSVPERLGELTQEHHAMVDALIAKDEPKFLQLSERHITYAKALYLFRLRTREALSKTHNLRSLG